MREAKPLNMRQLHQIKACKDACTADLWTLSLGYGISRDDAEEWYDSAPAGEIVRAIAAVFEVSGLGEGAQKSGRQGDDAGPERAGF